MGTITHEDHTYSGLLTVTTIKQTFVQLLNDSDVYICHTVFIAYPTQYVHK